MLALIARALAATQRIHTHLGVMIIHGTLCFIVTRPGNGRVPLEEKQTRGPHEDRRDSARGRRARTNRPTTGIFPFTRQRLSLIRREAMGRDMNFDELTAASHTRIFFEFFFNAERGVEILTNKCRFTIAIDSTFFFLGINEWYWELFSTSCVYNFKNM